MSYPAFQTIHGEFEDLDVQPTFYDTDGSPVYETPYGGLIGDIVAKNDVAALRLYHQNPKMNIWYEVYESPGWHPVFTAWELQNFDVLRTMMEIYLEDPRFTEPLAKHLERLRFSPIEMACAAANRDMTLWLLDRSLATLHDRDILGNTPLLSAAHGLGKDFMNPRDDSEILAKDCCKHEHFICFLLDQGCSVQASSNYTPQRTGVKETGVEELKSTVLGAAIPHASYKMVSRLIAEGAEVHARQRWNDDNFFDIYDGIHRITDGGNVTALHIASYFWNVEAIHALFDNNGDMSIAEMASNTDDHGRVPLHWALLGIRNKPHEKPIKDETLSSRIETVKFLLEVNPDMINARDKHGATVFNYAVKSDAPLQNTLHIVKMLLDAKPRTLTLKTPEVVGVTALEDAVTHHQHRYGKALDEGFLKLMNLLLDNGADARLCLHRLCAYSWLDYLCPLLLGRLLDLSDTSVNETDSSGCTPMHYLVHHMDQKDAAHLLINRGADINLNAINHAGNTPLHELLIRGSLLYRMDEKDELPLPGQTKDYMERVRVEWLKMLMDAGGLMHQKNSAGKTPSQLLNERMERLVQIYRETTSG
ncbi:ankyrin [Penicillium angulare]|uniref:Ankyrin n=1 Tax=Penicillium angulare TaxID=116970 RepID=A0A9W9FAT5_9EURO|nr:ankyrin [Penicillium angulare]